MATNRPSTIVRLLVLDVYRPRAIGPKVLEASNVIRVSGRILDKLVRERADSLLTLIHELGLDESGNQKRPEIRFLDRNRVELLETDRETHYRACQGALRLRLSKRSSKTLIARRSK